MTRKVNPKKMPRPAKEDPFRHHFRSFQQELRSLKAPRYGARLFRGAVGAVGVGEGEGEAPVMGAGVFFSTLSAWRELNLAETFRELSAKCHPLSVSLGLVVHNAAKINGFLKEAAQKELQEKSDLSLEPILELWHGLARDVGGRAFRPFLSDFCLAALSATRLENVKVIQQACSSLAGVLKIAQRSTGADHLDLVSTFLDRALVESWPQPDKMPEEIAARIAAVLAQVVRRSPERSGLAGRLLAAAAADQKLWTFVCHTLLACSLSPALSRPVWESVTERALGELDEESARTFWRTCCEKAAAFYADSYDELTTPVASRCREQWRGRPLFYLTLLRDLLTRRPTRGGWESDKDRGGAGMLRWLVETAPEMSRHNVPYGLVQECLSSQLDAVNSWKGPAERRATTCSLVDSLLRSRGQYSLEDVSDTFVGAENRSWRDALRTGLSGLATKLPASEENLLAFARVVNKLMEGEDEETAVFDVPEGGKGSFPSEMIRHLESLVPSWETAIGDIGTLTRCLSYLRPLDASLFDGACGLLQAALDGKLESEHSLDDDSAAVMLDLYRGMRKVFRPVSARVRAELLAKVARNLSDPTRSAVFRLVSTADPEGVRRLLGGGESDFEERLVGATLSSSRHVRLDALHSLCAMAGERDRYELILKAESAVPSAGEYRERLRLFQAARMAVAGSSNSVQRVLLQTVLCNLYENFSWLWKPTAELAVTLVQEVDGGMFWDVVTMMLQNVERLPAEGGGVGGENVCKNILRVLGKVERDLATNELSFLVKKFQDALACERLSSTSRRVIVQEYLDLFSRTSLKDTREREAVVGRALEFLKDRVAGVQQAAIGVLVRHTRGTSQHKGELLNLCDRHLWKRQVRSLREDFGTLGSSSPLRNILKKVVIGMLRRTVKENATAQKATRKIILESVASVGKDFLFEVVSEMVDDLDAAARAEWSKSASDQMVVDLCIWSKPMMGADDQPKMNSFLTTIMLHMSRQPNLFQNMKLKKKFLGAILRITNSSKDWTSRTLLDGGILDACILPVFEGRKLPRKLFAVLECWMEKSYFECFFSQVGDETSVFQLLARSVGSEHPEDASNALSTCCKLIREVFENVQCKRDCQVKVKDCWEQVYAGLGRWLSPTKLELVAVRDRLFALRFFLQSGWVGHDQRQALSKQLAVKCRSLENSFADDWLALVSELTQACEQEIPACLFPCIMNLKVGDHRERLCAVLSKELGYTDPTLDGCVQNLIETKGPLGRKLNLFVFYGTFCLLYKYAGTSWVQGMNLILKFLKKLKMVDEDEYRHITEDCLVPQVKRGLKSKDDSIFCSTMTLLKFYLENTSAKQKHFKDLVQLMDQDDDTDFFENAKHLQFHRRARIMRRVATRLEKNELTMTAATLGQVMMPLARRYVLSVTYKDQTELVDAGMSLIGVVCSRLKIDEYVKLLEGLVKWDKGEAAETKQFQKQKVDIISRILHKFSYDLEAIQPKWKERLEKLLYRLLVQIRKDKAVANLHVYIAVAKLAVFLSRESCVNTIVLDLCSRLKIKYFKDREIVRKTILEVRHHQFYIKVLKIHITFYYYFLGAGHIWTKVLALPDLNAGICPSEGIPGPRPYQHTCLCLEWHEVIS